MALEFMKFTPPPLLRQPSKTGYRYDSRHMRHPHKKDAERRWNLTPFINQYNSNPMNFLPGRITCKLMKLDEVSMLRAARAELAALKKANPNMRISTYGSHSTPSR